MGHSPVGRKCIQVALTRSIGSALAYRQPPEPGDGCSRVRRCTTMPTMSEAVRTMLQTNAEVARESLAETDAGFLWDFWYPAVRSVEIRGQKLVTAMLLEVPLVLGRTSEGKAFAMRDSCPHRGIPLSYGRLDGKVVECCYHGWRFDACSGRCVEIPSLTSQDKLQV